MSVEETLEARHRALMSLLHCAHYMRERDNLIRHAASLGITKTEIARILGMNRGHVSEIANRKEQGAPRVLPQQDGAPVHPKDDR